MNDDVPWMNHRVWKCLACKQVMEMQVEGNHSIPDICPKCGVKDIDAFQPYIEGGKRWALLIWDEVEV